MFFPPFPANIVSDDDVPDTVRPLDCRTGDVVVCRTYQGCIIPKDSTPWEKERNFKVIGTYHEDGTTSWTVYLPPDYQMSNGSRLSRWAREKFEIDAKYANDRVFFISEEHIIKVHKESDQTMCKVCKEWFHMAQPNQLDGTLICWQCRQDPWR